MTRHPNVTLHRSTISSVTSEDNVNPFDSPRSSTMDESSIQRPSAVLQQPHTPQSQSRPEQEQDEKQWTRAHKKRQPSTIHDPEKHARPYLVASDTHSVARLNGSLDGDDTLQERKVLKILLYLAGPCVLLSFITMFWALCSLLVTILYQPLRLCTPRLPFSHQLSHFLAPTLNLHLRCIYAQVYPRPTEEEKIYSAAWLLIVHFIAPVISLGNAIAAWVVALYWCLARVVGDPSGMDNKDDGAEAVLGLTRWWERCLLKGVRL